MKQILVVLLLTALATAGYVGVRLLTTSSDPTPALPTVSPGAPAAGTPALPTAGDGRQPRTGGASAPGGPPSDELAGPVAAPLNEEVWTEAAHGDLLPEAGERWRADLSGADLTADVVLEYAGGEITQEEFRVGVATRLASPLLEALASLRFARATTERAGLEPIEVADELLERRFELWCESRGFDPETGLLVLYSQSKLPEDAVRRFFDVGGVSALTRVVGAARSEELLAAYTAGIPGDANVAMAERMVDQIATGWAEVEAGGEGSEAAFDRIAGLLEQLSLFQAGGLRVDLGRRIWVGADHPLPEGAVLGVAVGELEVGTPPWRAESVDYVTLEEVWPLLEGGYGRLSLERVLSDLVFFERTRAALTEAGAFETDEQAWAAWSEAFEAQTRTLLGPRVAWLDLLGFPSLAVYREAQRLLRSFVAMQPGDWRTEDDLREFWRRNRLFVESWPITAIVAFFPAQSPEDPFGAPDWEGSRTAAEAFLAEVEAGADVAELAAAHATQLRGRYQEVLGSGAALEFGTLFRDGRVAFPLNEFASLLDEDYHRRLLDGGGGLYALLREGRDGEPVGPERLPLGHLVLRVDQVTLPGLEREFEDLEFQAREFHRDFAFIAWANALMADAGLPGQDG